MALIQVSELLSFTQIGPFECFRMCLSVFIVIGVGSDMLFVYTDFYKQSLLPGWVFVHVEFSERNH